jgi:murein DD-endopeptidase MepM/ murein hydrolase activator NlpD
VKLEHANINSNGEKETTYSEYGHMKYPSNLKKGDTIKKGDVIGYVGNTGASTNPHLHYTRRDKNNNPFEPPKEEVDDLLDNFNKECK